MNNLIMVISMTSNYCFIFMICMISVVSVIGKGVCCENQSISEDLENTLF